MLKSLKIRNLILVDEATITFEKGLNIITGETGAGKSAIGFGGTSKEHLVLRVADVNRAYDEGNAIGSHANGHFDGSKWNALQWELEFKEFSRLLLDVFNQLGLEPHATLNPYHFPIEDVVGFRAPILETNANMYAALRKNKYSYDTS